jgi:hypothetical protein
MLQIDTRIVLASELEGVPTTVDGILPLFPEAELWTTPDAEVADRSANRVLEWNSRPYVQNFPGWEVEMSALDLICNLGPESATRIGEYTTRPRGASGDRQHKKSPHG